jgi:hypothetical protein
MAINLNDALTIQGEKLRFVPLSSSITTVHNVSIVMAFSLSHFLLTYRGSLCGGKGGSRTNKGKGGKELHHRVGAFPEI